MTMTVFWRVYTCAFFWIYTGCSASDEAANALDAKLADLVSKGLLSKEKLAKLKQQLLEETSDDDVDASDDSLSETSHSGSSQRSRPVDAETPKTSRPSSEPSSPPSSSPADAET